MQPCRSLDSIKFRAWLPPEGMIYGDIFDIENDGERTYLHGHKLYGDAIIMLGIGVRDKVGWDVFHKDICIGKWPYAEKCLVEWDPKRCAFYLQPVRGNGIFGRAAYDKGYKINAAAFTVIGNAFENPELLTGK